MLKRMATVFVAMTALRVLGDSFVSAPHLGPTDAGSFYPFLIKETVTSGGSNTPSMRYQQVYDRSVFTNVDPRFIYVSTVTFFMYGTNGVFGWTVPSMQINLSTTPRSADNLSRVFSENVGADDTIVFGPRGFSFPGLYRQFISFDRPFTYNPQSGNLLLDVRIFDGSGPPPPTGGPPSMTSYNSPTDEVARVWATNVTAVSADGSDTIGLLTLLQLSPIPSLKIYTSFFGTSTNFFAIEWPTQPTVFVLQRSFQLGSGANWETISTGDPSASFQRYYFPADTAGPRSFFRLTWPSAGP